MSITSNSLQGGGGGGLNKLYTRLLLWQHEYSVYVIYVSQKTDVKHHALISVWVRVCVCPKLD